MSAVHQALFAALLTLPPAPPAGPAQENRSIALFQAGPVRCAGGPEVPVRVEEPLPVAANLSRSAGANGERLAPIRFRFRIDADGRPLSISQEPVERSAGRVDSGDVAPALASWRFRAGIERADCAIAFDPVLHPLAALPAEDKARYLAGPEGSATLYQEDSLAAEAFAGIVPPGSTCSDAPKVGVRTWTNVDPRHVSERPGSFSFAQIAYDVSRSGWASNVRVLRSSGNRDLDREAAEAMSASRFAGAPRKGCTYVYSHPARMPMAAPPPPSLEAFGQDLQFCQVQGTGWTQLPALTFPEPFRRRAIEGWAIIRYDVSPWGSIGNMQVVAAEPADAFGSEAMRILSRAKRQPSRLGASGCLQTLLFELPAPESSGG